MLGNGRPRTRPGGFSVISSTFGASLALVTPQQAPRSALVYIMLTAEAILAKLDRLLSYLFEPVR